MSLSDRSDSSDDSYLRYDEDVGGNGPTIVYHNAPTATPSDNTPADIISDASSTDSASESRSSDIQSEKSSDGISEAEVDETPIKADPNVGMVIVRMDDGGPRPRRTRASEIVIPIDSVSSSEIIRETQSEVDSSKNDKSPLLTAQIFSEECVFSNDCSDSETSEQDSSYTPVENDEEELDRESNTSNREYAEDNVSDTNDEDNVDDEGSDECIRETIPDGTRTTSNRFGISETSFVDLCKRFQDRIARYEEANDVSDRVGRQILRTHPNRPLCSQFALRMISSANYRLKNIGYVNMDSLPATSNSENPCRRIFDQQASGVGDVVETAPENETSADETPIENDSTSPVCSTRFDFTPAGRSKTEGARTACSDTANGESSVQSGRENPQAKYDSEVRPTHPGLNMQTVNFRQKKIHQVLPPIPKSAGRSKPQAAQPKTQERTNVQTKSKPIAAFKPVDKPEVHTRKQCQVTKPGIPHQLRSVACYRDGKVDVSITGDTRLIPESEKLDVNITFVHRPAILQNKEIKTTDEADDKHLSPIKRKSTPFPMKCPFLPRKSKTRSNRLTTNSKEPLPPLKVAQKSTKRDFRQPNIITNTAMNTRQSCNVPNHKGLPPLRSIPGNLRRYCSTLQRQINGVSGKKHNKKQATKHESLNWNIVNDRAQRPPFNTHINEEASERHQKIFANIPT